MSAPETLGIRHIALFCGDLAKQERFYTEVLGYRVEWRPDPENVYLTRDADNLALHAAKAVPGDTRLDHFGILLKRPEDVDAWAAHLKGKGVALKTEPRTHRDGARSFYAQDTEGNTIQFIWHPPVAKAAGY